MRVDISSKCMYIWMWYIHQLSIYYIIYLHTCFSVFTCTYTNRTFLKVSVATPHNCSSPSYETAEAPRLLSPLLLHRTKFCAPITAPVASVGPAAKLLCHQDFTSHSLLWWKAYHPDTLGSIRTPEPIQLRKAKKNQSLTSRVSMDLA